MVRRSNVEDSRLPGLLRYARINTLKVGFDHVRKELLKTGHTFQPPITGARNHQVRAVVDDGRSYRLDAHCPDVLVFKPKGKSDISRVEMVQRGELIIQQKASCFPALATAPPPGAIVIDACAAPGNKTSQLAALMDNRGTVLAFEQDERRCNLLRSMMIQKGASIVEVKHGSFLDCDPSVAGLHAQATHIMLDPSCSSSGMSTDPINDPLEIEELARIQEALLLHAMTFPKCLVVVYSTCSIHDRENEEVVHNVLAKQSDFELKVALPFWHRRGHTLPANKLPNRGLAAEISRCVVRCKYPEDETIGFFVCRFERRGVPCESAEVPVALQCKFDALDRSRRRQARLEKKAMGLNVPPGGGPRRQDGVAVADRADNDERGMDAEKRSKVVEAHGGITSDASIQQSASKSKTANIPQWRLEREARKKSKKEFTLTLD